MNLIKMNVINFGKNRSEFSDPMRFVDLMDDIMLEKGFLSFFDKKKSGFGYRIFFKSFGWITEV